MEIVVVCVVAFVGSALTLYSGFGLGTVLLPAMALLFSPLAAVAATGAVHLLNNVFKASVVRGADWRIVWRFGAPAIVAAFVGALTLSELGRGGTALSYEFAGRSFAPTWAGLVIGLLMLAFALLELSPWFQRLAIPARYMPLGGVLSGFFGGLAGQQGALRSAFLVKSGLDPQRFIATGVMIAILVDLARMPAYVAALKGADEMNSTRGLVLLGLATLCAFAGAWAGARLVKKVTIGAVRVAVALMMMLVGAGLAVGAIAA